MAFGSKYAENTYAALRIMTGFLLIPHGAQKMFGVLGKEADWSVSLHALAGPIEFFGGALILIGLWTRPTAFIAAGMMAVAYWTRHGLNDFFPIVNRGELAVLYCFVFLFLWANGGGPCSVDNLIAKRNKN